MSEIGYSQQDMSPIIIKVGGGAAINMEGIIKGAADESSPIIFVLGANFLRQKIADQLNVTVNRITSVSGYESVYSDPDALDLIMMTYAGLARNRFVECCQKHDINAIGLSGMDGRLIEADRNRGIRVRERGKILIKRDLSGKPRSVNLQLLQTLLSLGYTPVLSIPVVDSSGTAINADNDNIVKVLHGEMHAERIYQFIEAPGLLADSLDENSLIASLSPAELKQLEDRLSGRIKRKLLAIRQLFEQAPTRLTIADGRKPNPYQDALAGRGTIISWERGN